MIFLLNQMLNVSSNLQIAIYLKDFSLTSYLTFFNDVEEREFPSNCTKSYFKRRDRFFFTVSWVFQLNTVWNQKNIGLLILLDCEPASLTVFTTMCPMEKQTIDNLIVKDNYLSLI